MKDSDQGKISPMKPFSRITIVLRRERTKNGPKINPIGLRLESIVVGTQHGL